MRPLPRRAALAALALAAIATATPALQDGPLPSHPDELVTPPLAAYTPPELLRRAVGTAPLLLIEDHELPLVDGLVVFEAGSLRDPADRVGLAEFAADALREGGCADFTGAELNAWLDARAAELAFEATGDHLRISFSCLSQDLEPLLERLGALLAAPAFDEAAVETTRRQMLTAIARASDDAAVLADQAMERLLYGGRSPHGRVATETTVAAVTVADLRGWAAAHLGLDRLHLGLSGDLEPDAAAGWAAAAFGELPEVGPAAAIVAPDFWTPEHTRIFVVDRPGVPQTELRLAAPGIRLDDPDHPALTLWGYTVGFGGMSNRMMARIRTELGLAYSVGCLFSSGLNRRGSLYGFCGTRNEAVGEALSEMIDLITETGAQLIPADELEAARSRLLASQVFRRDSAEEVLSRAMTLELFDYPADFWERNLERLAAVDNEDVGLAVRKRIPPARFLVVAVGPADEIVPVLEAVAEVELLEPEQPLAPADDLVARMLEALGGAEVWAELTGVYLRQTVEIEYPGGAIARIPVEQHRSFDPLAIRLKQVTPSGLSYTSVIHGGTGMLKSATGVSVVPAEQVGIWQDQMSRWLYFNLHRLGAGVEGVQALRDADGRLVLASSAGELCWIELGEDDRPARMGVRSRGAEKVYEYFDWTEVDGIWHAGRFVEDGNQTATIELFEPNPDLPPSTWEL